MISQDLMKLLMSSREEILMSNLKDVSVLFSSIRGYTALAEKKSPKEVVSILNEYFKILVDILSNYQGTLYKSLEDGVMAVFGWPLPLDNHQWMAVQAAVEMQQGLMELNVKRAAEGQELIAMGIGIHSDTIFGGNISSSRRMEDTAIDNCVNLAYGLGGASEHYGCDILISESTYNLCADRIWVRELDYIKVKGKTQPISFYELVGFRTESVTDQKLQVIDYYAKGLELYRNRQFAMAIGCFATVAEIDEHDKSAMLHMLRCQHWLINAPPDDWDGSWIYG